MTPTMPPRREREREVLDEQPVAVALAQLLGLDDEIAEARAGRDRDLDLVLTGLGRLRLRHELVVRVDARLALRLPRARRHAHPFELPLEGAAPGLVDLLLLREPLLLLLEPARVVALPGHTVPAVELEDPSCDVVEEVAVVGHRDDGAVVLLQVSLEPGNGLGIEMVGRLVEQEQIGLAEQQPAERDAPALAAAQRLDVGVGRRQPQCVHRDLELAVEIPAVHARRSGPADPTAPRAACRSRRRAPPSRCRPPRSGRADPSSARHLR